MDKNEIALQLCLAIIKDVELNPGMGIEALGKYIADVYNSVYRNLNI